MELLRGNPAKGGTQQQTIQLRERVEKAGFQA